MKKTILALLALGMTATLFAIFVVIATDNAPDTALPPTVTAGYFKSDDRHRVMALQSEQAVTREDAMSIFASLPWTEGKVTQAYIYSAPATAPGARLTQAATRDAALDLVHAPPFDNWTWAYIRFVDGTSITNSN